MTRNIGTSDTNPSRRHGTTGRTGRTGRNTSWHRRRITPEKSNPRKDGKRGIGKGVPRPKAALERMSAAGVKELPAKRPGSMTPADSFVRAAPVSPAPARHRKDSSTFSVALWLCGSVASVIFRVCPCLRPSTNRCSALYGPRGQAGDEVFLQEDERRHHRYEPDEARGSDELPLGLVSALQAEHSDRDRETGL